jgi:homoaconitase/3-isopropylmalate dehydratase large subunit
MTAQGKDDGCLLESVVATDLMVFPCCKLDRDNAFTGSTMNETEMLERMAHSNMTKKLGGEAGIIVPAQTRNREWATIALAWSGTT